MDYILKEVKDERFQPLSTRMNAYIDQKKLSCIVSALFQDGKLITCEKYGKANIENNIPIEFDSIFRIASMSKPITAVAALMLYEEGHFSLDDPISKFIPKAKNLTVFKSEQDGEILTEKLNREVTMRDLFTHTGGFSYFWDPSHPYDQKFKSIMDKAGEKTLAEVVDPLFDIPLKLQPGTKFHYSYSTDVLGYIIEIISQTPLDKFLQDRIFAKLNMVDTAFYVPEAKRDRFVSLYGMSPKGQLVNIPKSQDGYRKTKTTLFSGGGGLVSTLSDYLKFAVMLLNHGKFEQIQLLKEETVRLMTTQEQVLSRGMTYMDAGAIKQLNMPPPMEKTMLTLSQGFGVGLGVQIKMEEKPDQIPMPTGVFGWGGAFLTDFWVDPKNNLVAIICSQFANGVYYYPLKVEVRELVYEGLKP